ncbi:TPA: hypothetical protein H2R31_004805 [Salmonella enterica]|nr:hypothetical protein [Salmonella enterica]
MKMNKTSLAVAAFALSVTMGSAHATTTISVGSVGGKLVGTSMARLQVTPAATAAASLITLSPNRAVAAGKANVLIGAITFGGIDNVHDYQFEIKDINQQAALKYAVKDTVTKSCANASLKAGDFTNKVITSDVVSDGKIVLTACSSDALQAGETYGADVTLRKYSR